MGPLSAPRSPLPCPQIEFESFFILCVETESYSHTTTSPESDILLLLSFANYTIFMGLALSRCCAPAPHAYYETPEDGDVYSDVYYRESPARRRWFTCNANNFDPEQSEEKKKKPSRRHRPLGAELMEGGPTQQTFASSGCTFSEDSANPLLCPEGFDSRPLDQMKDGKNVESYRDATAEDRVFPLPKPKPGKDESNIDCDEFWSYASYS